MKGPDTVERGAVCVDTVSEDTVVVVNPVVEGQANSVGVTYDYNMNEVTVYDLNKEHGVPKDDSVVEVVYAENLARYESDWSELTIDELLALVESKPIKKYSFPLSRLNRTSS